MPRNKNKQVSAAIVPVVEKVDDGAKMLINKLSVADARHLLNSEGELEPSQVAIRSISIVVVGITSAYAIWAGKATAWHLLLPMVAEYAALNVGIVVAYAIMRPKDMRKEARNALYNVVGVPTLFAISAAVQSYRLNTPWQTQAASDLQIAWNWISDYHMQWPMLAAVLSVFLDLPIRVKNLLKYGPPFVAVGLGCALRAAMPFLAFFILPFLVEGTRVTNAWIIWGLILFAEILALWMHWDIQRRLKKLDGAG